jgi:hypothetical protein
VNNHLTWTTDYNEIRARLISLFENKLIFVSCAIEHFLEHDLFEIVGNCVEEIMLFENIQNKLVILRFFFPG